VSILVCSGDDVDGGVELAATSTEKSWPELAADLAADLDVLAADLDVLSSS
jgi:hypothetical protein